MVLLVFYLVKCTHLVTPPTRSASVQYYQRNLCYLLFIVFHFLQCLNFQVNLELILLEREKNNSSMAFVSLYATFCKLYIFILLSVLLFCFFLSQFFYMCFNTVSAYFLLFIITSHYLIEMNGRNFKAVSLQVELTSVRA